MLKRISNSTQTLATIAAPAVGTAIDMHKVKTLGAQIAITVNTPSAKTFADGTAQVQVIDFVADVSGSLNSTYFLLNSINSVTGAVKGFYVWFNINSAGVDPLVAGRTAIPITGATNASGTTLAAAVKTALDALTNDFSTSGASTVHLTVNNANPGAVTAAADGTAATGFTFNTPSTAGVNSKVNPVLNTISITAHGYPSGLKLQASSSGTLPAGLSTSTDYFVILVDANTIQLASSLSNAQAGTAIDITGYGTNSATGTLTPTTLAGGSVQLQKSNDGITFVNDGSSVSVAASGTYWLEKTDPTAAYMCISYSLTAGSFSASSIICLNGEIN